ncbi:Ninjurin-1 [Habropoda laboriosa]|uniref:Ninjurin-1 n=1 Tax=Habropoda laboriosa TaxID=597456 RepID=A0A0L7QX50_9HYME|nr:PREDICTED: ninjurin-1-like [Habropoda laboriosa]XP_017792259.1 PREDICTED: ninjurin-1-like [Habropoda laboriosa]XP_017792260.1 PREDICTED: ninjurin-1-like [Habropoda laboriosa]KOC63198.1 Ninjurin-1 [Habropoda laboriosa]
MSANEKKNKVDVEEVVVQQSFDTTDKKSQAFKQSDTYAAKKTVAQGMMDLALITANANQLRYLIEYQRESSTFFLIMGLITVSLFLQVAVGACLICKGRFDIKGQSKSRLANRINNYIVFAVFLITVINVFIAAFSISVSTNITTQQ